jgi:hypothetical protein
MPFTSKAMGGAKTLWTVRFFLGGWPLGGAFGFRLRLAIGTCELHRQFGKHLDKFNLLRKNLI